MPLSFSDPGITAHLNDAQRGDGVPTRIVACIRRTHLISHRGRIVTGMIHDQFMDYLFARWFVRRCTDSGPDPETYLRSPLNVDVNRFIKAIWFCATHAALNTTLQSLSRQSPRAQTKATIALR